MAKSILGVHHVTAIAGDPDPNLDFYTRLLGLRLVKITVNFDDPASYHLYYGDSSGHPGTILTFFLWPGVRRGRVGNSQGYGNIVCHPVGCASILAREASSASPPGCDSVVTRLSLPYSRLKTLAVRKTPCSRATSAAALQRDSGIGNRPVCDLRHRAKRP